MKKFIPLILIIVSIGVFFSFIDPEYDEIKVLLDTREENKEMLELAEELKRKREELQRDFRNISAEQKRDLNRLLPETVDNVRLILDINNIAESFGLIITGISVSDNQKAKVVEQGSVQTGEEIGVISLGFSVVAPYELFIDFMQDLEESLRIVDIRSLNITPAENVTVSGEPFYNYSVSLDTYWLR